MAQLKSLKQNKKTKTVLFHVTMAEYAQIRMKAVKHTNGVVSKWIRYACLLDPRQRDMVPNTHNILKESEMDAACIPKQN